MVSSLSVHGTCQTATPGSDTVGKPASWARRPNSASSHLMKIGSDSPISRDHLGGDQAHPPAVVVDVDPAVQPARGAQRLRRRSRGRARCAGRTPEEPVRVHGLAEGVQHRARVQAEHVPADDRRVPAQVGEGDARAGCPRARRRRRRRAAGRSRLRAVGAVSNMAREKPPEPPRLGCSMTRRLSSPETAGHVGERRASSTTFWCPGRRRGPRRGASSTLRLGRASAAASTQKSGRLNVVMPIDNEPRLRALDRASTTQRPPRRRRRRPATTSNQYQPPSTNGVEREIELRAGRARRSIRRSQLPPAAGTAGVDR